LRGGGGGDMGARGRNPTRAREYKYPCPHPSCTDCFTSRRALVAHAKIHIPGPRREKPASRRKEGNRKRRGFKCPLAEEEGEDI
jgi:hypothetical protein